jgi:hypothetical protein
VSEALEGKYLNLYNKITEQSGGHFMHFDELSKEEFQLVSRVISDFLNKSDLNDYQRECVNLWNALLLPLFQVDERNTSNE